MSTVKEEEESDSKYLLKSSQQNEALLEKQLRYTQ